MAIIRWDPFNLPGFFTRWPSSEDNEWPEVSLNEGMDVYETESEVVVKAAVPGITADKVEVTFEDGVLRIKAHTEESTEEKKKKKVVYKQQRVSAFDYTTSLPRAIDSDRITAEVTDGVVTVKAPISPAAKAKKITVKGK